MNDLDKACQELKKAEEQYQKSLRAIRQAQYDASADFDKVVTCRKEVRRLTCIGSELAGKVYGEQK